MNDMDLIIRYARMLSISLRKQEVSTSTMNLLRELYYAGKISACVALIKKACNIELTIVLGRLSEMPNPDELLKIFNQCSKYLGYSLPQILPSRIEDLHNDIQSAPAFIISPTHTPSFGTQSFREFKVALFIFNWAIEYSFEAFVACITHELSHIMLHAMRHPLRNEEIAVDLTAILLGFYDIFREVNSGDTSFGYLTSHQIEIAYGEICRLEKVIYL